jgi:hypothetical protein
MDRGDVRAPAGVPVTGPDRPLLVRERLLDLLALRWSVRAITLSAAAGYGKTTLLAQAVAANAGAPRLVDLSLSCGAAGDAAPALGDLLRRAVGAPIPPHPASRSRHDPGAPA